MIISTRLNSRRNVPTGPGTALRRLVEESDLLGPFPADSGGRGAGEALLGGGGIGGGELSHH